MVVLSGFRMTWGRRERRDVPWLRRRMEHDGWYVHGLSLVQFMYLGAVCVYMESSQNKNQSREGLKRYTQHSKFKINTFNSV